MIYLEKTMKTLEARTGMIIPEGYDPEISILRLTLDPVNVSINSHDQDWFLELIRSG